MGVRQRSSCAEWASYTWAAIRGISVQVAMRNTSERDGKRVKRRAKRTATKKIKSVCTERTAGTCASRVWETTMMFRLCRLRKANHLMLERRYPQMCLASVSEPLSGCILHRPRLSIWCYAALSYAISANNDCEIGKNLCCGSRFNTLYQYSPLKTAWLTVRSKTTRVFLSPLPTYSEQFPAARTWSELPAATRRAPG